MNNASEERLGQRRLSRAAMICGSVACFVTSGVVSWATPDGNLVVTLVPAVMAGALVFGLTRWGLRARQRNRR